MPLKGLNYFLGRMRIFKGKLEIGFHTYCKAKIDKQDDFNRDEYKK